MAGDVTDRLQLGRTATCWVKQETTAGTQVYPTATDMVIPSGTVEFNQQPSYTNSTEVRDTRTLTTRFLDQNPAGTWSLPMYIRPSGTLGSIPDGHILFYAAFGSTTTYAGSSVTYTPSNDDMISLTVYVGMKDMVFALIGATVNEMKIGLTNKGGINCTFSGGFMTMKWAGKADTTAEAAGVFTVSADAAKKFCVGMKVQIWDASAGSYDDNSSVGYQVSAVGATSVTVTPDPSGYTWAAGDWLEAFLPSGTEVGSPIEARTGTCSFDGGSTDIPIISADFTLTNNTRYLEDEISTNVYPTSFISDTRNAMCSTQLYLRTDDMNYFKDSGLLASADKVQADLLLTGGDTSGSIVDIALPVAEGSVPNLSGDNEKIITIDWQGLGTTSYNDETKITFY
jgi:hypothetical protein